MELMISIGLLIVSSSVSIGAKAVADSIQNLANAIREKK